MPYKPNADTNLHKQARQMAFAELAKKYRAEYWRLCAEFFDQLKAERDGVTSHD